jgi:hypothetical protein
MVKQARMSDELVEQVGRFLEQHDDDARTATTLLTDARRLMATMGELIEKQQMKLIELGVYPHEVTTK